MGFLKNKDCFGRVQSCHSLMRSDIFRNALAGRIG